MKVLIIGGGGREHAIAWKLAQSSKLTKLYIAPGNPGTAQLGENIEISSSDHAKILQFSQEHHIDLVVIGPEDPLAAGLVDALRTVNILAFGPTQSAAEIESSKAFSKAFMVRHHIPTARYQSFNQYNAALKYLDEVSYPIVIKASGLAAGKGVVIPEGKPEGKDILKQIMLNHEFGQAGDEIVIEERLTGPEVSLLAFCDGKIARAMIPAQDHKRIFDGDRGPNTGGMGAYAPVPMCPSKLVEELTRTVLQPTIDGLRVEGRPFIGVLYAGIILTPQGPQVIEFNCRFGDPEAEVILPLLDSDLLEIFFSCVRGRLKKSEIKWKSGAAACVVLASGGYPGKYQTGHKIQGLDKITKNTTVFHAGTKQESGSILSSGGRVLCITGWGTKVESALKAAYQAVKPISFTGMQYRKDIGPK